MNTTQQLLSVETSITSQSERAYFWIHEARYAEILQHITAITNQIKKQSRAETRIRVLDVGCFPYHLGQAMEEMGLDVYGISSQHEPLQGSKIKTCNIEKDKFPFKDNFFDIVIFTEVLEHLPQAPLHTIREIYRVLSPGGSILITTPNIARSINRAKLLLGKSVTYPLSQVLEQDGKGSNIYHRHNREYTVAEVAELTRLAGFTIETATNFVSYTPWRRRVIPDPLWIKAGKIANYALMRMVEGLRDTVLVIGKKYH
jgi:2-polyprenyl-3-methyl-5-hydroxy-6-metoxy-1,4-benzoquinol methylase